MAGEIAEQPSAIAATIDALRPQQAEIGRLAKDRRYVVLYARGSSDTAAMYGRYAIEITSGRPVGLGAVSVATKYGADVDLSSVLVIALSQSGSTAEIVDALHWARRHGAVTIGISNDPESDLIAAADVGMALPVGRERAVPATKTYTAELVALANVAAALADGPTILETALATTPAVVADLLHSAVPAVHELAEATRHCRLWLATARGLLLSTAAEAALKLQETCRHHAIALSSADLQHGPSAMLGPGDAALVIAPRTGVLLDGATACIELLRQRGVRIAGIGGDERFASRCDHHLGYVALEELVAPLAAIVPGQLLAERLAVLNGLNPDAPAGLDKITQTSV